MWVIDWGGRGRGSWEKLTWKQGGARQQRKPSKGVVSAEVSPQPDSMELRS